MGKSSECEEKRAFNLIAPMLIRVDLSYVILKAALLLKHIGSSRYKQCIEYLEYLLEDPPTSENMTRTHVLAVLLLVYEQGGPKYQVLLSKHYKDLAESYHSDMLATSSQEGHEHDHSRSIHITETGSEVNICTYTKTINPTFLMLYYLSWYPTNG